MNPFNCLCDELVSLIFTKMDFYDKLNIQLVCRRFHDLLSSPRCGVWGTLQWETNYYAGYIERKVATRLYGSRDPFSFVGWVLKRASGFTGLDVAIDAKTHVTDYGQLLQLHLPVPALVGALTPTCTALTLRLKAGRSFGDGSVDDVSGALLREALLSMGTRLRRLALHLDATSRVLLHIVGDCDPPLHALSALTNLEHLAFAGNSGDNLVLRARHVDWLVRLTQLRSLSLENVDHSKGKNNFDREAAFDRRLLKLTRLEALCLVNTNHRTIPTAVTCLPALRLLALEDQKQLTTAGCSGEVIAQLTRLTGLVLRSTKVSRLPDELFSLTGLELLDCMGSECAYHVPAAMGALTALRWLGLGGFCITFEDPAARRVQTPAQIVAALEPLLPSLQHLRLPGSHAERDLKHGLYEVPWLFMHQTMAMHAAAARLQLLAVQRGARLDVSCSNDIAAVYRREFFLD